MSLTGRILISFALMALAAYYLLLDPVMDRVERQYLEAAEEPMVDVAQMLAAMLSSEDTQTINVPEPLVLGMEQVHEREIHAQIYNLLKKEVSMGFYVTDELGRILYDSGNVAPVGADFSSARDVRLTLMGQYGARSSRLDEEDATSSMMYVGAPILRGDQIIGVLSVYKPQRSMLLFIYETRRVLLYLGATATVLFMLFGWLLSRWVTAPIRDLTEYAAAVARGERADSPKLPGKHLRVLSETTETMRQALEDRKYVESYVQTLTHEMKSPISGIRGASELLAEDMPEAQRKRFLGNIQAESIRLQSLIDQLLALASIENRTGLGAPTKIELASLVRSVVDHYLSGTSENKFRFELDLTAEIIVQGEAFLLETAISNLVQNAIDFSPLNGCIQIKLLDAGGHIELSVLDEGPGIPDYASERIFDRFYSLPRPGTERKSSGLGLCFVREAIQLHGGQLSVRNRTERSGVCSGVILGKSK